MFLRHLATRCLVLVGLLAMVLPGADNVGPRITQLIDRDWTFLLGDAAGAEAPAFDDRAWAHISLPHSFSIPYFQGDRFYVGYGWYRRHLPMVAGGLEGRRLFLEFDGVFQDAEVFVNGRAIGRHQGGYTGFSFDISSAVTAGDNLIAVRVNNLWNAQLAPRAGEHAFSGGIYRHVRLLTVDPLHVAWYGTFVTTPELSEASGSVRIQTELTNDGTSERRITLTTDIVDDAGKTVATISSPAAVSAGMTIIVDQKTPSIAKPRLWHPDHPTLYTAVSTIRDQQRVVDRFATAFGFRWFTFTAGQGFFLNGKHHYFRGANVHQDRAGWGDAASDAGFLRDVQQVKDAGMDFIRGSHYPHAPSFVDACDRLGMLFWSENCFWGTGGFKGDGYWNASAYPVRVEDEAGFEQSVADSLRDMIRIHRNHPAIIVWSMSNEPFFSEKPLMPKVRALLSRLVLLSKQLDPTRPAAIGGAQRGDIDKLGDIAGYNGDGATIRQFQNPGVASVVSEYASIQAARPGPYASGFEDQFTKGLSPEQVANHAWRYPWRSGEALWCAFDHGSIAGKRLGSMGFIDYYRLPKRSWYWYRNEYLHIAPPVWPVPGTPAGLRLTASAPVIARADGRDDVQVTVMVVDAAGTWISNELPISLTVLSGPGELPTGRSIVFDSKSPIQMRDGLAAIDVRAHHAGTIQLQARAPGLPDAMLTIVAQNAPPYIAGASATAAVGKAVATARETGEAGPETEFGADNPTAASSEAPGRSPLLVTDGDPATSWQAADVTPGAWWQVDLERNAIIRQVTLNFPDAGPWRVRVEGSDDKSTWRPFGETAAGDDRATRVLAGQPLHCRTMRVTFLGQAPGQAAALSEFRARGVLSGE